MKKLMVLIGIFSLATVAFGQADREEYNGEAPVLTSAGNAPVWDGPGDAVLYDNGPVVNSAGTGVGGADESVLQTGTLGMGTLGFGHQVAFDNRIADDFTVPAGETWTIETITFFAYQTGAPTSGTITGMNVNVMDAMPPGGSIVASTTTVDSTGWTNAFRVTETTTGGSADRAIQATTVSFNPTLTLTEGTYWLDWQTDGSLGSGPWAPPVTINGTSATGNGLQSVDGGATYGPANDGGTGDQQGFPFIIEGPACAIDYIAIADVDYNAGNVYLSLSGECAEGVDIRADATGAIVATDVVVSGSTSLYVDLVLDSSYTAILPDGSEVTTASATVPTLGEWGLIAFLSLITAAGVYFMRRRRLA